MSNQTPPASIVPPGGINATMHDNAN